MRLREFQGFASTIVGALLTAVLASHSPQGHAALADVPLAWSIADSNWAPMNFGNIPLRDGTDASGDGTFGATPNDPVDFSSGFPRSSACNPTANGNGPGANCGPLPTFYVYLYDPNPNNGATVDQTLFVRMRFKADPRKDDGFEQFHYNTLIDVDDENHKEFWLDLNGPFSANGEDRLDIRYQDNASQEMPAGVTIDTFYACHSSTPSSPCANSFTRSLTTGSGAETEYFVDVQLPLARLLLAPDPAMQGKIEDGFGLFFSTSNSNSDPLQKDYSNTCNTTDLTCTFGNPISTPISLSAFHAQATGKGWNVNWKTALEVDNAGFEVLDANRKPVARIAADQSKSSPQALRHYSVKLPAKAQSPFWLKELETNGQSRVHGPFAAGMAHGRPQLELPQNNWTEARELQQQSSNRLQTKSANGNQLAEVLVSQPGLQRLTGKQLRAFGINLDSLHVNRLALREFGQSEAAEIYVSAKGNRFTEEDFIEFISQHSPTEYSAGARYLLLDDATQARRVHEDMRPLANARGPVSYRHTQVFEQDLRYSFAAPVQSPWFDRAVLAFGAAADTEVTFNLDDLYMWGNDTVKLTGEVWGVTDFPAALDHHLLAHVNGVAVHNATFAARDRHVFSVELPVSQLFDFNNRLKLTLPNDLGLAFDQVNFDKLTVEYPRRMNAIGGRLEFNLDQAMIEIGNVGANDASLWAKGSDGRWTRQTVELQARGDGLNFRARANGINGMAQYQFAGSHAMGAPELQSVSASQDIRSGSAGYLILTDPAFLSEVQAFAQYRRQQGLDAVVVTTDQIYRQFGRGVVDATAIADYLKFAATQRSTRMVLLVGGDTYDYRNRTGAGSVSFMPSLYVGIDDIVRFAPSDSALVDFDRNGVPELSIGRLPARNVYELATMIAKIKAFEAGSGTANALFIADRADAEADFKPGVEALMAGLPANWSKDSAYLDHLSRDGVRSKLFNQVANGVRLVSYHGHSAPIMWSFEEVLGVRDVPNLQSATPWVANQYGCWNTYHVDARTESLGRSLLASTQGAVAAMGPSALANVETEEAYATHLIPQLMQPGMRLGDAILQSKQAYGVLGGRDIQMGWNLLGDPALVVNPN